MLLRPFLNEATSCASYLFGCGTHSKLAVVDPHAHLVDDYLATAAALGAPVVAVFETHLQADHLSGLPELVARSGATAYLPADTGVEFEHVALADGDVVELGNTTVTAMATPGHAPAHHAYTVADRRRGTEEPWLVFSGDSLLIGDVGLGLRANARQFALLVALNALVGGMVGLERSVLPLIGKQDFGLSSTSAILAFVVAFGAAKAVTNLAAGGLAERLGRKRLLVIGWLVALPVP